MKKLLLCSLAVLMLFAIGSTLGCSKSVDTRVKEYRARCVPGPGEKCMDPEWYADYLKWKDLKDKNKIPDDINDQLSGMAARLNKRLTDSYKGMQFDEVREIMIPMPGAPPAPPQALTPVPGK